MIAITLQSQSLQYEAFKEKKTLMLVLSTLQPTVEQIDNAINNGKHCTKQLRVQPLIYSVKQDMQANLVAGLFGKH